MMTFELHRHDARRVSELVAPGSVDLIVTSPPYFALRSYRDGGVHYDGQVGSEASPSEFVDALIECTRDWLKVLKPTGSLFVNLGDKYAGSDSSSGGYSGIVHGAQARAQLGTHVITRRGVPRSPGIPAKSKMGLPWRYALRCIDELGLILRADIIWNKPNGLPESVTDRVRASHEYLFHFVRQGRYYAAIDEVREAYDPGGDGFRAMKARWDEDTSAYHTKRDQTLSGGHDGLLRAGINPLGKVPGSVWTIPSEPLQVPAELGVDHFAAFPSELPRRCILGWTPTGWCRECGDPRRPVVDKTLDVRQGYSGESKHALVTDPGVRAFTEAAGASGSTVATITGYCCACPTTDAPTTPSVVLDPFCGTGTTPAVAHHLARHGIGTDLSADYLKLAHWRCTNDRHLKDKVLDRTGIPNPQPPRIDGQLDLFGDIA